MLNQAGEDQYYAAKEGRKERGGFHAAPKKQLTKIRDGDHHFAFFALLGALCVLPLAEKALF